MPEPGLRSECLRTGAPMHVGGITLLLVERSVTQAAAVGGGLWCWSTKAPYAMVVRDGAGLRAIGIEAVACPIERLREQLPGLDAVLASM